MVSTTLHVFQFRIHGSSSLVVSTSPQLASWCNPTRPLVRPQRGWVPCDVIFSVSTDQSGRPRMRLMRNQQGMIGGAAHAYNDTQDTGWHCRRVANDPGQGPTTRSISWFLVPNYL